MPKLTITESVKVIPVSESKLRRDMKAGVVSFEVDEKGKKRFDPSELRRVYGELTLPDENGQVKNRSQPPSETGHDRETEILAIKDNQITDLRNQLEKAEAQLQIATTEKTKLLDLLSAEKEEKYELKAEILALMPPPEEREQKTNPTQIKPRGWFQRLLGA